MSTDVDPSGAVKPLTSTFLSWVNMMSCSDPITGKSAWLSSSRLESIMPPFDLIASIIW
eukprot:CAMPEP_0197829428 /NCGR_PEP_ID=MMETSP1437-20131217/5890_1 /TAXON_ID=49252 ORGANISM="Eucampia antarctica, Strain CCMP1452" /NCGR_SAMPLE_ID=MMETSP1437 /ASSEMBLY_ACC=CAM_ASM_001096 /LENGTH=58 /DNA_ID=CAMNT_0043431093 /DNA_START=17 /DNA_END=190 /DNA_ORIENTATION=+